MSRNHILPFASGSVSNDIDLFRSSSPIWRLLYWFGPGMKAGINSQLSAGEPPVFSDGSRSVTVILNRKITWSDGQPVTNKNLEPWMNIYFAGQQNYLAHASDRILDGVTSMSFRASPPTHSASPSTGPTATSGSSATS